MGGLEVIQTENSLRNISVNIPRTCFMAVWLLSSIHILSFASCTAVDQLINYCCIIDQLFCNVIIFCLLHLNVYSLDILFNFCVIIFHKTVALVFEKCYINKLFAY